VLPYLFVYYLFAIKRYLCLVALIIIIFIFWYYQVCVKEWGSPVCKLLHILIDSQKNAETDQFWFISAYCRARIIAASNVQKNRQHW